MNYGEAILLGIVQGLTEFLPISSSGHLALGQELLGMTDVTVTFDLLLHAGTLLTVLLYFWRPLFEMTQALWQKERTEDRKIIGLLAIATVPAVVVGFTLQDPLEQVKHHPMAVCGLLILTGILLMLPKWLRKTEPTDGHTVKNSIVMGLGQALAILPGISRSGSSISLGMLVGLRPEKAAQFSFLMAIPAISGAILLKRDEIGTLATSPDVGPYAAGAAAAFLTGIGAVYLVMRLIKTGKFAIFAYYCFAIGLAGLVYFGMVKG